MPHHYSDTTCSLTVLLFVLMLVDIDYFPSTHSEMSKVKLAVCTIIVSISQATLQRSEFFLIFLQNLYVVK